MAAVSHEPEPIDLSPETPAEERTGHPLFPRSEHEAGPDRRRIDLIHIERTRDDGTWEACPKTFKATELRSWKDIVDLFGGGAYRARAQCGRTYQWQGTTERKEFTGPSKPFVEESKRAAAPAPPPSPPPGYGALPPHGPAANHNAPGYPPPGWAGPPAWALPNPHEPPPWLAVLIKAMERPAPAQDQTMIGLIFKAMADQNALVLRMVMERQGTPATAPSPNTLELIRELKPLLDSNTAPGQFMQGIEMVKSLMQQSAPPAPPPEDFATTLAGIMRNFAPGGGLPFPGMSPPAAPTAAPAPPAPAPPAAPLVDAPTLSMDDMIGMIANDRRLTQRFLDELRRRTAAGQTGAPPYAPASPAPAAPLASPAAPPPVAYAPPPAPPPVAYAPPPAPQPAASGAPSPDEAQVGTTVATEAPPQSDTGGGPTVATAPPMVGPDGLPPELSGLTALDLRALVASMFVAGPEAGAEPNSPPAPPAREP